MVFVSIFLLLKALWPFCEAERARTDVPTWLGWSHRQERRSEGPRGDNQRHCKLRAPDSCSYALVHCLHSEAAGKGAGKAEGCSSSSETEETLIFTDPKVSRVTPEEKKDTVPHFQRNVVLDRASQTWHLHKTAGRLVKGQILVLQCEGRAGSPALWTSTWRDPGCCLRHTLGSEGPVGIVQALRVITSGLNPATTSPDVWPRTASFWLPWTQIFIYKIDLMVPISLALLLEINKRLNKGAQFRAWHKTRVQ